MYKPTLNQIFKLARELSEDDLKYLHDRVEEFLTQKLDDPNHPMLPGMSYEEMPPEFRPKPVIEVEELTPAQRDAMQSIVQRLGAFNESANNVKEFLENLLGDALNEDSASELQDLAERLDQASSIESVVDSLSAVVTDERDEVMSIVEEVFEEYDEE